MPRSLVKAPVGKRGAHGGPWAQETAAGAFNHLAVEMGLGRADSESRRADTGQGSWLWKDARSACTTPATGWDVSLGRLEAAVRGVLEALLEVSHAKSWDLLRGEAVTQEPWGAATHHLGVHLGIPGGHCWNPRQSAAQRLKQINHVETLAQAA